MADAHTAAKALLFAAGRHSSVAAVASVDATEWFSRVHAGDHDGFIAGLHRGRLPAVELFQRSDTWKMLGGAGDGGQGTTSAQWVVRVHSGLPSQELAEEQCRSIIYAMLIKVRENQYFWVGDDVVSNFDESPLGYSLEVQIEVITAMGRDTFETTPNGGDGEIPTGGDVGGISKDINWSDTSPVAILAVPSGQALDGIQLKVTTPFDGVGASITVGVIGDQSRYLAANQSDLTINDSVWENDADDIGPQTVYVWVTPGTGASQGVARIQIQCTGA